ncbi:MAG: hypothetical protein ABI838_06390 [Chloroflexota bacterium]
MRTPSPSPIHARLAILAMLVAASVLASGSPASAVTPPTTPRPTVRHYAHPPSALRVPAKRPAQPAMPAAMPTPTLPIGYIPGDVLGAYGIPADPAAGAGTLIAIIDAYDTLNVQADLTAFDDQFGLRPPPNLTLYPSANPYPPNSGAPWAIEIAIDVEWAHALAPGADIALVYSRDGSDLELLKAVDYAVNTLAADVVSMSWTIGEYDATANPTAEAAADITAHDLHFPPTNGKGRSVTYFAAASRPSAPPSLRSPGPSVAQCG